MTTKKSELYPMINQNRLVGFARRSNQGRDVKISINVNAINECETYTTSDGETYVPLIVNMNALKNVISGERAVTTVSQAIDE